MKQYRHNPNMVGPAITAVIEAEGEIPLTDSEIAARVTAQGHKMTRRAVCAWRRKMHIPDSYQRLWKKEENGGLSVS